MNMLIRLAYMHLDQHARHGIVLCFYGGRAKPQSICIENYFVGTNCFGTRRSCELSHHIGYDLVARLVTLQSKIRYGIGVY